ncbi:DMT family transporter [Roseomonas sp. BN140053]|uniref:DMT family transporter n=1 Tax=Roseomonas sp. BN140053 TaxID=3391898 RepID=UPI0039E7E599
MPAADPWRRAVTLSGWPLWWRLLLISALWGAGFPLVRIAAAAMPPFALAFGRALLAVLAVLLWAWFAGALRGGYPRAMLRHALVLGTTNGWLPNVLTAIALVTLGSAQAALIQSASPLMVAAAAAVLLPHERLGPAGLAGLLLGVAGLAIILGPASFGAGADPLGGLLMLAAAASYAAGNLYTRVVLPGNAAQLALGQQAVSALGAGALMLGVEGTAGLEQPAFIWATLAALAVLASALPVTLFVALAQRARATDSAMTGFLQPVFAAVLGAVLLAEWPQAHVLAGGAVILAGVWLATRRR